MPDFCILPDRSNPLLNFGKFQKAKNVSPHCPIFLHFLLLSYYFLFFSLFCPLFSNLRSTFAQLIDISIFLGGGQLPPPPPPHTSYTYANHQDIYLTYSGANITPFPLDITSSFLDIIQSLDITPTQAFSQKGVLGRP